MRGRERLEASDCDRWGSNTGATGRDVAVKIRVEERRLRLKRDDFKVVEKKRGSWRRRTRDEETRMPLVPPTKVFIKAFGGEASSLGQCSSLGGRPPGHLPQLPLHLPRPSIA